MSNTADLIQVGAGTGGRGAITPVLLSGGAGSRLWPLSRERYPKQLLSLCGEHTMIQDTALRVSDAAAFAAPIVVCNQEHRFAIAEQLQQVGITPSHLVLEPFGRNTAPAAAVAARLALANDPDALLLLLPADHVIMDLAAFRKAVDAASVAARAGHLVTFGISPTAPETGYGYIQKGARLDGEGEVFRVERFTEKPKREVAEGYLAAGTHVWNSGMFLFAASAYLAELEMHAPEVLAGADAALNASTRDLDFLRLNPATFEQVPNLSIDYAVMEKTRHAAVVPADLGWTDVGAWSALWDIAAKDADGNVTLGDAVMVDTRNSYVRSEVGLTALVGVDDVIVVVTDDAVLVADRNKVQDVKTVVERLKAAGRSEPLEHKRVYRPWGYYQSVHAGTGFQVKRITVYPGRKLSLQMHNHRAEHWVVVQGTASVTVGDSVKAVNANESVYIPLRAVHRLENVGTDDLHLIEVQTGGYLGEDDIIRLEDNYGRA